MKLSKAVPAAAFVALALFSLRPLPSFSAGGVAGMLSAADLAARCLSSIGPDGFGSVDLQGQVILANARGTIDTPCRLHLVGDASLTFANARLTTAHLVIRDGAEAGSNSVSFHRSQVTGNGYAGLLVDLHDSSDSVVVTNSVLDYSASVWIRSLGNRALDSGGGKLIATSSSFTSSGDRTEGVQLVTGSTNGGQAILTDVKVTTSGPALAVAEDCVKALVEGVVFDCSGSQR